MFALSPRGSAAFGAVIPAAPLLSVIIASAVLTGCPLSFEYDGDAPADSGMTMGTPDLGFADAGSDPDASRPDTAASPDEGQPDPPDGGQPEDDGVEPGPDLGSPDATVPDEGPADDGVHPDAMVPDSGGVRFDLTVSLGGNGEGTVLSVPSGIQCGPDCTESFPEDQLVTLQSTAATGSRFVRYAGDCSGSGLCQVRMTQRRQVTAVFERETRRLTVQTTGSGSGVVSSNPAGISCGNQCTADFPFATMVALSATPASGARFVGWSGACSGNSACMVEMSVVRSVTAEFEFEGFSLTVQKTGTGNGLITASSGNINCGATCTDAYAFGTTVTLTAQADPTSNFDGFSGDCIPAGNRRCIAIMDRARTVQAEFSAAPVDLEIQFAGNGGGRVTSMPAGVDCTSTCRVQVPGNMRYTLTAAPETGSALGGWGGDCSGATCVLDLTAPRSVSVDFSLTEHRIDVGVAGAGRGRVVSDPVGIDCGVDCNEIYPFGTEVRLVAMPEPGSAFRSWSGGGCGLAPECTVTITAAVNVTATFDEVPGFTLAVTLAGIGVGVVESSPPGIQCPGTCNFTFAPGTDVVLVPSTVPGSGFAGWSGDCGRAGECGVTMTADRAVTATFDDGLVAYYPLDASGFDASRNGHNAAMSGTTNARGHTNQVRTALNFPGNGFGEIANDASLSGFAGHSECAWVRPAERFNNPEWIIAKTSLGDFTASTDSYGLAITSDNDDSVPLFRIWTNNGGVSVLGADEVALNAWVHLCGTYDGTTMIIYVDGVPVNRDNQSGAVNQTNASLRLGRCGGSNGAGCGTPHFDGRIDEVKIWRRALTDAEITAEFLRP